MKYDILKKTPSQLVESQMNVEVVLHNGVSYFFENGNNGDIFFFASDDSQGRIFCINGFGSVVRKTLPEVVRRFVGNFKVVDVADVKCCKVNVVEEPDWID